MALTLKGNWDASINSPVLSNGFGTIGDLYYISAAGMQDLGLGTRLYNSGFSLLYTIDNTWNAFAVSYKVPLNEVYGPGGPGTLPPYIGEPVPTILSYIVDVVGNTSGSTSGSTIPNLEQVLTAGNTADKSIILNYGGLQTFVANDGAGTDITIDPSEASIFVNNVSGAFSQLTSDYLAFSKALSPFEGEIIPGNLTNTQTYTLPDLTGTIAIKEFETLEVVTGYGNTTDHPIIFNYNANQHFDIIGSGVGYISAATSGITLQDADTSGTTILSPFGIVVSDVPTSPVFVGSLTDEGVRLIYNGQERVRLASDIIRGSLELGYNTFNVAIITQPLTTDRVQSLQDKDGIIALTSDIVNTSGTVTSFSTSGISTLFTTNVANPTTAPNLTFSPISEPGNKFFASPNGTSGIPLWRSITNADIPLSVYQIAINTSGSTIYVPYIGAINNVDLNTHSLAASQININSPSFTSGVLNINGNVLLITSGATPITLSNAVVDTESSVNSYLQHNIRNANNGANASSDYIVTTDTGTDTTNYIDMGINNSGFSQSGWTINGALDGYVYTASNNLAIGTASIGKVVDFFTGGTLSSNRRMRIDGSGNISMYQFNTSGGVLYTNTSGLLQQTTSGVTGQVFTWNNGPVWGNSGTSGITSFSSPDNSIFTSGVTTSGGTSTIVEINTANPNTWTALQTHQIAGIGTTTLPGLSLLNSVVATVGNPKYSPALNFLGNSFNTGTTTSIQTGYRIYATTISASTVGGNLLFDTTINGGSTWTTYMTLANATGQAKLIVNALDSSSVSNATNNNTLSLSGNISSTTAVLVSCIGTNTNNTGSTILCSISSTYSQGTTPTTTNTDLKINRTITGNVGSGTQRYISAGDTVSAVYTERFGVDNKGAVLINTSQTTLNGALLGTAIFSQPFQGLTYKKVIIYCNSLTGATASYTFPTAFVFVPAILVTNGLATTVVTTLSTSGVIVTGNGSIGFIILEGY